jgi:hypothetical protein
MKKLLLSSALAASVLFTGASFAETKVSGSLETTINTLSTKTSGTADNSRPTNIGHEAVLKISTKKALSNGLNMSAGFALDSSDTFASDQFVTLSSGNTSISIGNDVSGVTDNVSQEDFTPHVSQSFHDAEIGTIGSTVTAHGSNGIYVKHKADMLTFEAVYSPTREANNDTAASANSEASGSGFDVALKGNLGVPGLTVGYGISELTPDTNSGASIQQKATAYGVKYAMAGFTVGYGFVENEDTSYKTPTRGVTTETATYGIAYQINKQLSVSAALGDVDVSNIANDVEYKTVQVGYDFGGMGITAGYYEVEDLGGAKGTDQELFEIRTVTKF